jgi:hypothetical protein
MRREFPHLPQPAPTVSPQTLKQWLDGGEQITILDIPIPLQEN